MAESEAIKPLKIDADLWSHRDLIERIVSRWFHIIEDMDDVEIGWRVNVKGQDTDSEKALDQLNKHLNRLSWFAILQEGKPFDLVIMPKLFGREPGLSMGQMTAVWLIFTSFLTLAGVAWLGRLSLAGVSWLGCHRLAWLTWLGLTGVGWLGLACQSW